MLWTKVCSSLHEWGLWRIKRTSFPSRSYLLLKRKKNCEKRLMDHIDPPSPTPSFPEYTNSTLWSWISKGLASNTRTAFKPFFLNRLSHGLKLLYQKNEYRISPSKGESVICIKPLRFLFHLLRIDQSRSKMFYYLCIFMHFYSKEFGRTRLTILENF